MKSVRERGKRTRADGSLTRGSRSLVHASLPALSRSALALSKKSKLGVADAVTKTTLKRAPVAPAKITRPASPENPIDLTPAKGRRAREADRRAGTNDRRATDRSGSFDRNAVSDPVRPNAPAPREKVNARGGVRVASPPVHVAPRGPKSSGPKGAVPKSSGAPRGAARVAKSSDDARRMRAAQQRVERRLPTAMPIRTVATPRPDLRIPSISVENVDWEDTSDWTTLSPLARWARTERELKKRLEELGSVGHGCRADLREGRFVWVDEVGSAIIEARAQLVCTLGLPSLALTMAWADPILSSVAVPRVADIVDEQIVPDDETAREIAMRVADACGAEFVYRMPAPHVDYFLALRSLRPTAGGAVVTPGSPVGMVLRGLADLRRSLASRTEPTNELRARFHRIGKSLTEHAESDFKETEWIGRLGRAGKVVMSLAVRLAPPTYTAIAAGLTADEWLAQSVAVELTDALKLLEDEWGAFAV